MYVLIFVLKELMRLVSNVYMSVCMYVCMYERMNICSDFWRKRAYASSKPCMYVRMYLYVCTYVCMYVTDIQTPGHILYCQKYWYKDTKKCVLLYVHLYFRKWIFLHIQAYIHTWTQMCFPLFKGTCEGLYESLLYSCFSSLYIHTHTYTQTHTNMYVHTYIYTHT
jgi:hypothetical protein